MTEQQRKEAIEYIDDQLENGYVDLGIHDKDELVIVKEAINLWKSTNRITIEDNLMPRNRESLLR